jgi:hypothetical protein
MTCFLGSTSVFTIGSKNILTISSIKKGIHIMITNQNNITAITTIAAVRSAHRNISFTTSRNNAVTSVTSF